MIVPEVITYIPVSFSSNKPNVNKSNAQREALIRQAKEELKMIEKEGNVAGSESAWWRYEYDEALAELKKIANGILPEDEQNNQSLVARFHSFDDDGFI